jgi:kynureninase
MRFGPGAQKLRTGAPNPLPMVALVTELCVLATSGGGDLGAAIRRAREVTHRSVTGAVRAAEGAGLQVTGPRNPARRAAFFSVHVREGARLLSALAEDGVIADFRAERPGAANGVIRLSANAASFGYELSYAVERLAGHALAL